MGFSLEDLTTTIVKFEKTRRTWTSCGNLVQTVCHNNMNLIIIIIGKNVAQGVIYAGAFGSDRTYHTPDGFCFDLLCTDDAINDNSNDDGYNLDTKVNQIVEPYANTLSIKLLQVASFANTVKSYANYYKTNNVIITMGGDFYHQAADINYENSDRLIK